MTTILADNFDTLTNWSPAGTLVPGRTGTGMQISGSSAADYTIPAGPLRTVGETARFSWRTSSLAIARGICMFSVGFVGNQVTLRAAADGALHVVGGGVTGSLLGATAPGLVAANTWYTLEVAVHVADSPNGVVVVKLDGVELLHLTGVDTFNSGGNPVLSLFRFLGNGSGTLSIFDDLLLTDDDPSVTVPPPTPVPAPPLNMAGVVVGFQHTITPGRWVSTLHTSTSTPSY